jgi:hypothetical protein
MPSYPSCPLSRHACVTRDMRRKEKIKEKIKEKTIINVENASRFRLTRKRQRLTRAAQVASI